ncbi:MAG: hypothetical protein ACKVX7_20655 [Planctomycetota bacterium]
MSRKFLLIVVALLLCAAFLVFRGASSSDAEAPTESDLETFADGITGAAGVRQLKSTRETIDNLTEEREEQLQQHKPR